MNPWKTPSNCNRGDCVAVMMTDSGNVAVKSTKRPGVVFFSPEEWVPFLEAVKAGEFDLENLT